MEIMQNIGNEAVLSAILDAYPYQIVLCDRNHIIRYMNKNAAERYNGRIAVGDSIFGCHREDTCRKIEAFLARADAGEDEMFEANNPAKQEREFFTPARHDTLSKTTRIPKFRIRPRYANTNKAVRNCRSENARAAPKL